jgi:flavin reductase (DIM6/NTAB) family NADH-FMN oxidoreductase RutF
MTDSPPPVPVSRVDAETLKHAMRGLPAAVSVVTAGTGDDRTGATVTSVASFSMAPPTMMVSLNRSSSTWLAVQRYGHFCINVLRADQRAVAERFAGRDGLRGPHRYAEATWAPLATGALALEGALASIDCELEEAFERHSHALVLGRVSAITLGTGAALLYGDGRYGTFAGLAL